MDSPASPKGDGCDGEGGHRSPRSCANSATCVKCGGPTAYPLPPRSTDFISPPPTYRPIRAPAVPLPPRTHGSPQEAILFAPVPQPLPTPTVSPPYQFTTPIKVIRSPDDLRRFHSPSCPSSSLFLGFVASLSQAVLRRKLSDPCHVSTTVHSIVSSIESLILLVDQIPPLPQPGRYGNPAFRSWHEELESRAELIMLEFLPEDLRPSTVELVPYFLDSFGNATRIDYGTGHETNFAAWLYCLARLGVIEEGDYPAVVTRVFAKYLELMRKLQIVYSLEPAGSHGVWGLDDYHFLPFIFGAAQLVDHKYMKPKSIHNVDILENFSNEYMYLSCIQFIRKVKKGPFSEHSPLLDDISGVPNWSKVNSGLLKMYKAEVLEKVPIMQHFLFGWLIPWEQQ
ncbi:hypothetical protein MLD38_001988 [Melastoma candidum]|uniref:Uncharacterized protein n=1 Tax=Melastoma candidum TaxID=119954 RepID=A0ACB9SEG8_9MYRT|nr:hypothetical protein MLD38_001988 [Melastoma candidum]